MNKVLEFIKNNFLVIFLIFFCLYMFNKSSNDNKEIIDMYKAMQDSTVIKIDKLGRKYAETSQIRTSDTKVFLTTNSNDPSIKALQEEVKTLKNKLGESGSVTKFNSDITIQKPLTVTYQNDGSIFTNATDNKWYFINNTIKDKKGFTDIKIHNKYTVNLVKEGKEYVAQIRNENPYATTDSVKSFVKIPKEDNSRYSLGIGVSYNPFDEKITPTISIHRKIFDF